MKKYRFGKTDHSKGFVAAILLTVSLSMACGRSGLLGPDEVEEAAGGADGAITSSAAGGRSSGSSLGGAGAGGSSSLNGGASASSTSKPVSGGAGGNGGAISVVFSSTKPAGGASTIGGAVSVVGGVSAVAGSRASGGASAIGGSSSTLSCADAKSCGGDVVGAWNVTSSCLKVSGQMNMSDYGLSCAQATVEGSLQTSGTWIARANGVYSDKTTTSGNLQISLPASCLKLAGTTIKCKDVAPLLSSLGYTGGVCNDAKDGCSCQVTVKQVGSMGIASLSPWTSGVYETNGNTLVIDSTNRYGYCVSGTQLTLTPQSKNPPMTGAIVFQKQ